MFFYEKMPLYTQFFLDQQKCPPISLPGLRLGKLVPELLEPRHFAPRLQRKKPVTQTSHPQIKIPATGLTGPKIDSTSPPNSLGVTPQSGVHTLLCNPQ